MQELYQAIVFIYRSKTYLVSLHITFPCEKYHRHGCSYIIYTVPVYDFEELASDTLNKLCLLV